MKLSEFINTYTHDNLDEHDSILGTSSHTILVNKSHLVDSIETDDSIFNKYGVIYAMRHCMFLCSSKLVQECLEYLLDFCMNNVHAKKESFLNPYTVNIEIEDNGNEHHLRNPYDRNYEVAYSLTDAVAFFQEFIESRVIEKYYDNASELIVQVEELKQKHNGIRNPIVQHVLDASIKRNRLFYGEQINVYEQSDVSIKNIIKKNTIIKNILDDVPNDTVLHVTENLMCMFDLEQLKHQVHRIRDYVFMSTQHNSYSNIFVSWEVFQQWCKLNEQSLKRSFGYFDGLMQSPLTVAQQQSLLQELSVRDTSVLTVVKPQVMDFENNMLCVGLSSEEIQKNYNRQKLHSSLQSLIKSIIGE